MNYSINTAGKSPQQVVKHPIDNSMKAEVKELAQMYEDAINRSDAEQQMWNGIQRENAEAIYAQYKRGEISEKVSLVRQLMNDAMAHRAYARCAEQADIADFRLKSLKQIYPQYFPNKAG